MSSAFNFCCTARRYIGCGCRAPPEIRLLLHYDAKADIGALPPLPPNASLIPQRVNIRWAGFQHGGSHAAPDAPRWPMQTSALRTVSGNCVLLNTPAQIEARICRTATRQPVAGMPCRAAPALSRAFQYAARRYRLAAPPAPNCSPKRFRQPIKSCLPRKRPMPAANGFLPTVRPWQSLSERG